MKSLSFNWNHDTPEGLTYNLYEDGVKVVSDIETLNFTLIMEGKEQKEYTYYVTSFDTRTKLESVPSQSVSVNFTQPSAPTGLSVSFNL